MTFSTLKSFSLEVMTFCNFTSIQNPAVYCHCPVLLTRVTRDR